MLPRVKIFYENGALGAVDPNADGVLGIICTANAVADTFELQKPYTLRSLANLDELGITETNNASLYKLIKEFYAEAGTNTEVWLYGVADSVKMSDMADLTKGHAKNLIQSAQGKLRGLVLSYKPASYTPTIANGLDGDVVVTMQKAQELATWSTDEKFAPLFVIIEGNGYTGNAIDLADLKQKNYNRVAVLIGDTVADSKGAAVGLLAGRVAKAPVQRNVGRVKDGQLNTLTTFVGAKATEIADVASIHDKGYITFRTYVGRSGYFFTDDVMATQTSDDYSHITARRTIDKAYRIAYKTLLNELLSEIPVNEDGTLQAAMVKSWQGKVESAISNEMSANGELSVDVTDSKDKGVKCYIDYRQNVLSTSTIKVQLRVRPFGYARMIDVYLGFTTTNA